MFPKEESGDSFNLLVGEYYFDSGYKLHQSTFVGPGLGGVTIGQYTDHRSESYAGFVDAQFSLTDDLKLTLGGRYTKDSRRITVPAINGKPRKYANLEHHRPELPRLYTKIPLTTRAGHAVNGGA